ncbi:MAG: hypothetical protein Q9216_004097, partial [Gyalolechia sp. 2 TL-2023]
ILPTIVPRPLAGVAQTLVRLANLLELLRRGFVPRVLVRMVHNRQLAVRLLDLVVRRILFHAEQLVVVLAF